MGYEAEGTIHLINDTVDKSATFKSREFVIKQTNGEHVNFMKFELIQDRVSLLDAVNVGDTAKVYFDVRGREWQGKYFTNLHAWKIEAQQSDGNPF